MTDIDRESARRRRLRNATQGMFVALAAVFFLIYVYGLLSPAKPPSRDLIEFGGLAPGSAELAAWRGRPVWIVRRDPAMRAGLQSPRPGVDDTLPGPGILRRTRSLDPEYGVYFAATERPGVLVQYVAERPRLLPVGVDWYGGFLDPGTGRLYDGAGRAYPLGGKMDSEIPAPLAIPPHRYVTREMIELGVWATTTTR